MLADEGWRPAGAGPCHDPEQRSRLAARLLEEVFRPMIDDNELHPAVEHVYAALCEVETQAAATERRHP